MFYALVYYPDLDETSLDAFRRKHDPYVDLIAPHVTFVFPVPDSVGEENLTGHIGRVLSGWEPFDIHLAGFDKSWDHWLLLLLKEGNKRVIRLYEQLYTGILAPHLREDLEFIPHVALGYFGTQPYDPNNPQARAWDKTAYQKALEEAKGLGLDSWHRVDKLTMVNLTHDFTKSWNIKEFCLQ